MKPKASIAIGLILTLAAGPALAQAPQSTQSQQAPPATQSSTQAPPVQAQPPTTERLDHIRQAVSHEPTLRIENGQLKIYVEVIGNWPSFAEYAKGFDFINGPGAKNSNPMSHAEFVAMSTPQDMYSTAGIKPAEILTMAAVNVVGQWAITKALTKISTSRKEKQMRDIQAQIDAELAAIKKK